MLFLERILLSLKSDKWTLSQTKNVPAFAHMALTTSSRARLTLSLVPLTSADRVCSWRVKVLLSLEKKSKLNQYTPQLCRMIASVMLLFHYTSLSLFISQMTFTSLKLWAYRRFHKLLRLAFLLAWDRKDIQNISLKTLKPWNPIFVEEKFGSGAHKTFCRHAEPFPKRGGFADSCDSDASP